MKMRSFTVNKMISFMLRIFAVQLLLILVLSGCGGSSTSSTNSDGTNDTTSNEEGETATNQTVDETDLIAPITTDSIDVESLDSETETTSPSTDQLVATDQSASIRITQLDDLMQPETIGALAHINKQGFLVAADTSDLTTDPERRLLSGTLDGLNLIISEGDSLPNISTRRRVDTFESLSVASDGSVSAIATTRGQSVESVVIVNDATGLRTLFRTGQQITTVNTRDFPIQKIFAAWRSAGRTLVHVATENENQAIILEESGTFSVIAETADIPDLFDDDTSPTVAGENCRIDLNTRGYSMFKPMAEDGSIILGANHDANCDNGYTIIRYKDGVYSKLVSNGDIAPGTTEAIFSEIKIIELSVDGTAVIQAFVSRNDDVTQVGLPSHPFGHSRISSLWQINPDNKLHFMVAEGEEVKGPEDTYYLTDEEVDFRKLVWTSTGNFALVLDRAGEDYLFEGVTASSNPYSSFDELGMANMRFVFSTIAVVDEPFPETAFYESINPIAILEDGRTLFMGEINNLSANTSIDILLQVSVEADVTQTVYQVSGRTIEPLVENADRFPSFTQLETGAFLMHAKTVFGQYFLTIPVP